MASGAVVNRWGRDYFDIDDILMMEENISCTFKVRGLRLGFLEQCLGDSNRVEGDSDTENLDLASEEEEDESNEGGAGEEHVQDLPAGSKVEIPFWLAETLGRRNIVTITLPRYYSARVRNDLRAGSQAVNLSEKSLYYYELGFQLSSLVVDDELADVLRTAYSERCWRVVDSTGWEGKAIGVMAAMQKLENVERRLYMISTGFNGAHERWKERCAEQIGPSRNQRKRQLEELTLANQPMHRTR